MLNLINKPRGYRVFISELLDILTKLNKAQYYNNFQNGKSASHLAIEV